ncbi:MAG: FAD-dependent oxidoreductase [Cytophagales bacterium]|nr:FAD-dependent oxidoreductase [Armatimonadota bacterium]
MGRKKFDYDLAIIGGGSAGIVAGNMAGGLGARVALVEKSRIGGECSWTGCVPSKALLHVADVAHQMRSAKTLGLKNVRLPAADCGGAFEYVRRKIEEVRVNDGTEQMLRDFGVELFFGGAEFVHPHLVRTPQGDLSAAQLLIATGSSPIRPEIPGLEASGYRTNQTLYDLHHIPETLVVIGGGYIAVEMGQALSRLGSRVTIVDRGDCLLKREDRELALLLQNTLADEGIELIFNAEVTDVRLEGDGRKALTIRDGRGGERRTLHMEEILAAVGRVANTRGLNLESVGVALDKNGSVTVDQNGRTTAPHIWACGDVTGRYQFSHMAEHESKLLVRNILFPGSQAVPYDVVPWATFTDPELAQVGLTEEAARETYGPAQIQVLRHEFRQDDRAIVEGNTIGLVKVIVSGLNGNVVGAHILGANAGDLIHEWVIAIRHKLPVRAIADLIHVYPTTSVSNQRAAQRWYAGIAGKPVVKRTLETLFGFTPRDAGGV